MVLLADTVNGIFRKKDSQSRGFTLDLGLRQTIVVVLIPTISLHGSDCLTIVIFGEEDRGGSNATKRKRLETQGSLANALDAFLQNWIAEQPQAKSPKSFGKGHSVSKGKGKGKIVAENPHRQVRFQHEESHQEPESSTPRGGDVPLARTSRTLLNILKQCLNKGSTDSEVVAILRQQLKDPNGGSSEFAQDPGDRAQAPSKPRHSNRGKGVGLNTQTQQSTQVPNVTALRPAEWTIPPDVCSSRLFSGMAH